MQTYDLHGYKLEEALTYVEKVIGQIRLQGLEEDIKIITGRGIIRKELINYFEQNQIEFYLDWGNDAIIIASVD